MREIIERQADRLPRLAWVLTSDKNEIEDLCQEALAKLTSPAVLARFRLEGSLDGYLARVATREMVSYLRSQGKTWRQTSAVEALPEPARPEAPATQGAGIDEALRVAFRGLPARARLVVLLIAVEDMSYAGVAAMLDMEVGTVKSTYSRARGTLRAALDPPAGNLSGPSERQTPDG